MNNLEKYLDQVIEQRPVVYEPPSEPPQEAPTPNLFASVQKRWYIALLVFVLICAVALPAIWLLVEPYFIVQGAVNVAPSVPGILSDEAPGGGIGAYGDFVNTQATLLTSGTMLERIADDLAGRGLSLFSGKPQNKLEEVIARFRPTRATGNPAAVLKNAISREVIRASHVRNTTLLAVTMKSRSAAEAKQVVDSFLRNFQAVYGQASMQEENQNLQLLETRAAELLGKIQTQRKEIRQLAQEFGTMVLSNRQDMEMQRMIALSSEWTRLEAQRIALEAEISLLEQTEKASVSPEQLVVRRREQVNADPMVRELSARIVEMERDILIAQQTLMPGNPVLVRNQATLEAFKQTLENKRRELEDEFDAGLDEQLRLAAQEQVEAAHARLREIKAHEEALRSVLDQQDTATRQIGRTNLDIQDKQFQLQLDEEQYQQISRRIKAIEIERQARPRITPAFLGEVIATEDKRVKMAGAVVFGALACGFALALLRDKMDKTLQTPDDVVRHLDLPIIGTTTSSRTIKPAMFAEQIAGDYQMIRTNLGMLNNGGMPKRLVISSAGMREGKTTFAVNLATSLAKSGKKVLLIDGDMRKPDVGYMLNIANGSGGLQEVLLGEDPSGVISVLPSSGLHVLPASTRHLADAYELLTSPAAAEQIERLARDYDHLIIDSPPALAFPDALVWAKLGDAVILVSFAGQTTAPELKETKERFARVRAKVLGAVLSNVPVDQSLYRYAYTYRARNTPSERKARKPRKMLLPIQSPGDADNAKA